MQLLLLAARCNHATHSYSSVYPKTQRKTGDGADPRSLNVRLAGALNQLHHAVAVVTNVDAS